MIRLQRAVLNAAEGMMHLFYPSLCTGCGHDGIRKEQILCVRCWHNLGLTGFAHRAGNPVEQVFRGRLPVAQGFSLLYFTRNSIARNLLHALKYGGKQEVGLHFGTIMGEEILKAGRFDNIDGLVPVPLLARRRQERGYNQAAVICSGIASVLHVPVMDNAVIRTNAAGSQTKRGRSARWLNAERQFIVPSRYQAQLQKQHIMLVDDVLTTGATLEACGAALVRAEVKTLSIATMAYTLPS